MKRIHLILILVCCYLHLFAQTDSVVYVYFQTNQSKTNLPKAWLSQIDTNRFYRYVRIEAFTDSVGSTKFNQKLSEDRAAFVKNHLETQTVFRVQKLSAKGELLRHVSLKDNRCVAIYFRRKPVKEAVKITSRTPNRTVLFDPKDTTIFIGKLSILHGIKFELNSSVVKPESYEQIDSLVAYLNAHPTMKIHLRGHVCCQPAQSLSDNRAKKIVDLLIKRGIAPDRLTHKGYSNKIRSELSDDPFSEEQRRVEFEIVSF